MFKDISDFDLVDQRVFIRADFNIAIQDGVIQDETRILATLPTIQFALRQKAKVILGSHLGRPNGEKNPKFSLLPVAQRLAELLGIEVMLSENTTGSAIKELSYRLKPNQILLLENLRFDPGEKNNDDSFVHFLASLTDIYINDAFGTAHRAHASIVGLPEKVARSGLGFLMKKEIEAMDLLLNRPQKPFWAVLGGAKVSDKLGVIENLLGHVDGMIIGGGMAYTFLKAQGYDIGKSLLEPQLIEVAKRILQQAEKKQTQIVLPIDSVASEKFEENPKTEVIKHGDSFGQKMGLDIGPQSITYFEKFIQKAKTVFWNGPMGAFEIKPFDEGTKQLAKQIAQCEGYTVVGGGDSLAAVKKLGFGEAFSHLCTGGGASMEYLEGKILPGLKVLQIKKAA